MKKNPAIDIKNWGINGEGIGYFNRKPIFVDNAVPGEKAIVQITEEKPRFYRGTAVEIVNESSKRRHPVCSKWQECGGCALSHIRYKEQVNMKREILKQSLEKYAGYKGPIEPVLKNPSPLAYRNALKTPLDKVDGEMMSGMYKKESADFVGIEHCLIHTKPLEYARNEVVDILNFYPVEPYNPQTQTGYRTLIMRELDGKIQVTLVTGKDTIPAEMIQEIMEIDGVVSLYQSIKTDDEVDPFGKELIHLAGEKEIEVKVGGLTLHLQPRSFYQLNARQAASLYEIVVNMVPKCHLLVEAYCGIGAMALMASSKAEKVIGIESIADAVKAAQENAEANDIHNCQFICGDAAEEVAKISAEQKIDCLIVDPPRSGLSDDMLKAILKARIKTVIYVSCNPSTLGKNLDVLRSRYWIDKVQPVDMFSQTPHVETVVVLSREKVDGYIDIDLDVEKIESKTGGTATYAEIKAYVEKNSGLNVSNLYIAQIKDKLGLDKRKNYNTGSGEGRVPTCPPEKESAIMDAFKHFGLIA